MKLSVIIPCFNAADTIGIQLDALANQYWSQPWEIIVADNGSTDDSLQAIAQYQKKLPHLRIVNASDRQGAAHARNVAASVATGDLLAFCDADDQVAPGWVAAMGEALSQYDIVAGKLEPDKLNESWLVKSRGCPQQEGLQDYIHPPYLPHAASCNLGIKRSLHEAIGGFDESGVILEDTDYCWRVQLAGTKLHFIPEAIVHYRFRKTLGSIYRQARAYGEGNVFLYKRYRPLGMPELVWQEGVKAWMRLLAIHLPKIFSGREMQANLIWRFGRQIGRLHGCIKYRVLAL